MCGRFTLRSKRETVAEAFDLDEVPELPLRYNIAPTQSVPVVRLNDDGGRHLSLLRWGLIPAWADDQAIGNRMINARSETVAEKPAFRTSFKKRRCLVIADGFYEWEATGPKSKTPWYFHLKGGAPFGFAGLWELWEKGEEPIETCTLITTEANGVVCPVHDRMPVIVRPDNFDQWLDPRESAEDLKALLVPLPDELMGAYPVGRSVNNPKHEWPGCIERAEAG